MRIVKPDASVYGGRKLHDYYLVSDTQEIDIDGLLIEFFNHIGEGGEDLEFEIRDKRTSFSDFLEEKLNLKGENDETNKG